MFFVIFVKKELFECSKRRFASLSFPSVEYLIILEMLFLVPVLFL